MKSVNKDEKLSASLGTLSVNSQVWCCLIDPTRHFVTMLPWSGAETWKLSINLFILEGRLPDFCSAATLADIITHQQM